MYSALARLTKSNCAIRQAAPAGKSASCMPGDDFRPVPESATRTGCAKSDAQPLNAFDAHLILGALNGCGEKLNQVPPRWAVRSLPTGIIHCQGGHRYWRSMPM